MNECAVYVNEACSPPLESYAFCLVLFSSTNNKFLKSLHVLILEGDGSKIQAALAEWTGQRTVPNVFIGGKHIGGCDTVVEKHQGGKLVPLLRDAGALALADK